MPGTPESLTVPPRFAPASDAAMDPLLDLLREMRLTGGVFLDAEFTSPWCVTSRVDAQSYNQSGATPAHVIAYHYVTEGHCILGLDGQTVTEVHAGEIILIPRNDPHRLGSATNVRAVSASQLVQRSADGGLARVTHGGGGERTRLLCGFLGTSTAHPPIADVLPPALTIAVEDAATGAWIESSFRFAVQEYMRGRPDSIGVLGRLAEVLFIEAVRRHVASLPPDEQGWLSGLRDPVVGRALALLHGDKAHRWTVTTLARECGASRSALADRFTTLVGESPIRYLARQRLRIAAERLRQSDEAVAAIALDVGYESEAAFSRAFKREFGKPPAAWRRA